jgi:hypothetical protein
MKRIYTEFLTDSEIASLLDNKDLWMDGEEVLKRLSVRHEKFQKLQKAQEKTTKKPAAKKPAAKKAPVKK